MGSCACLKGEDAAIEKFVWEDAASAGAGTGAGTGTGTGASTGASAGAGQYHAVPASLFSVSDVIEFAAPTAATAAAAAPTAATAMYSNYSTRAGGRVPVLKVREDVKEVALTVTRTPGE